MGYILQQTQFYGLSILPTLKLLVVGQEPETHICRSVHCLETPQPHVTHCGAVFCLTCGQASEWRTEVINAATETR